jgi:hypothetical protein
MIAISRTRGFSAGNLQTLLTNNTWNAAPDGVMALTFFGRIPIWKTDLYGTG